MTINSKSNKKFICIVVSVLLVLSLIIICVFKLLPQKNIDKIELSRSENLISKYPDIVNQFIYYQRNCSVELFEYTDTASYIDTLMYYYFGDSNFSSEKWKKANEEIKRYLLNNHISDDNAQEIIYLLYYYGLMAEKNNNIISPDLIQCLYVCEDFIVSQESDNSIYVLNEAWKVYCAFKMFDIIPKKLDINKLLEKNQHEENILSELSFLSIKNSFINDTTQIEKTIDYIINNYDSNNIDIESLIIYFSLFSKENIYRIPQNYIKAISDYCYTNYYSISSYISFAGFRISEIYNDNLESEIKKLCNAKPVSDKGLVPSVARIIPTYRRIFQYSEICHVMGINLDKAIVYEFVSDIDQSKMMVEDFYYASLLARNYPDIIVDKESLKSCIRKAEDAEVFDSNLYSYYYLVKAAALNKLDCLKLVEKVNAFYLESKSHFLITDIWTEEMLWICGKGEATPQAHLNEILNYEGESQIEIFYQYALYLRSDKIKCPAEIKDKIQKVIDEYYVKSEYGSGFWMNSDFKYIDISQTYKCLFLENYLNS